MKSLILYYSITGKNKKLAEEIHKKIDGKIAVVEDKFKNKSGFQLYFIGGLQALLGIKTKIKSFEGIQAFEKILVVSPVWSGRLPPAVQALLINYKLMIKTILFASVSKAGAENKDKILLQIEDIYGKKPSSYLFLKETDLAAENLQKKLNAFIKKTD